MNEYKRDNKMTKIKSKLHRLIWRFVFWWLYKNGLPQKTDFMLTRTFKWTEAFEKEIYA